jgi:hypothetical protein
MRREGYAAMIEMCGYVFSTFFVSFVWLNFCVHNFSDFSFPFPFSSIQRAPRATLKHLE